MSERQPGMFDIDRSLPKSEVATKLVSTLGEMGFEVVSTDFDRPWGGFAQINNEQAQQFIERFFSDKNLPPIPEGARIDPKILYAEPMAEVGEDGKKVEGRLSWQWHRRRGEYWKVVEGPVAVYKSETDEEPEPMVLNTGEDVFFPQGTRHRLSSFGGPGYVAEIWINTDNENPSDENDIIRVADDHGRGTPAQAA